MEKRRNCSEGAISLLFHNILLLVSRSLCVSRFSLRDKPLFEISEFEITRVDCNLCAKAFRLVLVSMCNNFIMFYFTIKFHLGETVTVADDGDGTKTVKKEIEPSQNTQIRGAKSMY